MRIKFGQRAARIAAVAALTAGTVALATGSAYAAGPGGVEACPSGSVCLYYNSPGVGWGSFDNFSPNQNLDLHNYTFAHYANGSGYGQNMYGNAASIVNNTGHTVYVSQISDGFWISYPAGYAGSLNSAANNDARLFS
ncbi:peptidase inhibitor family I36 protein [Kitasatospora sp. NPDC096204]|uniref:peptidase inhibitor family I36 protein n=1 Tax=Kitasatospora sp. NPDC096204 TaxID=3364094 RepID=UPI003824585C